jgi:hypothetical protein
LKLARETRPAFTSDYTRMFAEGLLNHKAGQRSYPPIDPRAAAQNAADLEAMGIRVGGKERQEPTPNGSKRAQARSTNGGKRFAKGVNRMQPPSPNRVPQPSDNGRPAARV